MSYLQWQPGIKITDLKKEAVRQAILHYEGNMTKAAEALGVGKSTLYGLTYTIFTPTELRDIRPVKEWWK